VNPNPKLKMLDQEREVLRVKQYAIGVINKHTSRIGLPTPHHAT